MVWLGNHESAPLVAMPPGRLSRFDAAAQAAFVRLGHRYVNTARVIRQVVCLTDAATVISHEGCVALARWAAAWSWELRRAPRLHYGAISYHQNVNTSGVGSAYITQALLNAL